MLRAPALSPQQRLQRCAARLHRAAFQQFALNPGGSSRALHACTWWRGLGFFFGGLWGALKMLNFERSSPYVVSYVVLGMAGTYTLQSLSPLNLKPSFGPINMFLQLINARQLHPKTLSSTQIRTLLVIPSRSETLTSPQAFTGN